MNEPKSEVEPVLISALNQYVFCPRRCALMFVEGIWDDNEHTAIGSLLHDHTDEPGYETEPGVTLLRALPLFSNRYGLSGKADIVEVWSAETCRRFGMERSDSSHDQISGQNKSGNKLPLSKRHSKVYAPVEYNKGK